MCRTATAEFGPALSSAALARHWIADRLDRWGVEDRETAMLLTSELVTNAVVHTGSGPSVAVAVRGDSVEVSVSDGEPRLPRSPGRDGSDDAAFMAEEGRGLFLVDRLADEWGVTNRTDGKSIWFRLSTSDWAYSSLCTCDHGHPDSARLASGRNVVAMPGPWDDPDRAQET